MGEISWDQPGAPGPPRNGDLWPKTVQNIVFIDLSSIWDGFCTDLGWIFHDLGRFPTDFL